MPTANTLIPLAEYLATTYRPDCDYVDGEVRGRRLGERPHSLAQAYLVSVFGANGRNWKVWVQPEQRVQVRPDRYRVPNICVLRRDDPFENIVTRPPLLCVEILSLGDTLRELQERVNDYAAMGWNISGPSIQRAAVRISGRLPVLCSRRGGNWLSRVHLSVFRSTNFLRNWTRLSRFARLR